METKYGRSTSNDKIRHCHRTNRNERRIGNQYLTIVNFYLSLLCRLTPSSLVSLAGLASVAEDRTLNNWRNKLQAHLLLTIHETSLNIVVTRIGNYWKRQFCMGFSRQWKHQRNCTMKYGQEQDHVARRARPRF